MNQAYSLQYSVKVKKGLENKIKKGEWNGQAPYGYKLVDSHLQVVEEHANVIKLIFDLYLTKSWGSEKICNYLNEQQIPDHELEKVIDNLDADEQQEILEYRKSIGKIGN